jgi:hypothetical protein
MPLADYVGNPGEAQPSQPSQDDEEEGGTNKPKWWQRLIGFGLGATQINNPQNAARIASGVVNRGVNSDN